MTDKLTLSSASSFWSNPKTRAIAALAIAILALAWVPILVRLGEHDISPTAIIFNRIWIAAIILGLWNLGLSLRCNNFHRFQIENSQTFGLLLGGGIGFGVAQLIWAWSLTQTSVANSALLHCLTPLFVTLGGWLLFSQNFPLRFTIGTIVAIIGSFILGLDDFLHETTKIQGDTIALISAFFFAVYLLLLEQISDRFEVITIVFYYCLISIAMLMPFLLLNKAAILPFSLSGWFIIIALACTLLVGFLLLGYSIKWLSSGLISVVLLLEPILSTILAWVIFGEALDVWNVLAFPLILWGIYLASTNTLSMKDEISP